MKSILGALAYLRTHNVVHRDLHMANWCLRNDKDDTDIVIVDFGWACPLKEGQKLHLGLFAPPYGGPEALCDLDKCGGYDTKSDVWAGGAIMYRMLIGEDPANTNV